MLIDIDEAYDILFAQVRPGPIVTVPLADALFRTLAEDVRTDVDGPPFDRAVMDGYAVRAADVTSAPVELAVVGHADAGGSSNAPVEKGQAVRINTGAPIPPGADAVVRVEDTESRDDGRRVLIHHGVRPGTFVTRRGEYVRAGDLVLPGNTRLTPAEMGVAAGAGAARVSVYRQPRVGILSTGNELVEVDQTPTGGQIRNTNQAQLAAHVRAAHCEPVLLGTAKDDPVVLERKIREGLSFDVLCVTGGVSMGTADHVPDVLRRCGAEFRIEKMAIKPGRPAVFATTPTGTLVFALPGNPVSAFLGFELLVRPALAALQGRSGERPKRASAVLRGETEVAATSNRRTFLPAITNWTEAGRMEVRPLRWRGSGDIFGVTGANAFIVRPPNAPPVPDGGTVEVMPLNWS